jgi:molybdenum cofactor biosynthesis enzyme MoaA
VDKLQNLRGFIDLMNSSNTRKIILTGTTTDPQLYKYEGELIRLLRDAVPGAHISLHTNGLLAVKKIDTTNMYDTCTISLNSFDPATFVKLHGVRSLPDLKTIMVLARVPIKLSCVLTEHNVRIPLIFRMSLVRS